MEFKGTKGNWQLNLNGGSVNNSYNSCVKDENDNSICNVFYTHDENLANALLISKAPEMLEMLKWFVDNFDGVFHENTETNNKVEEAKQLIKEATELKQIQP